MGSIGLAIIAKNEAEMIRDCLKSAVNHVDEIVLLDTGSTDGTQSIARNLGARVIEMEWHDDFATARNQSLKLTSTDYILVLDADERIEQGFRDKLEAFIEAHPCDLGVVTIRSPWTSPSGEENIVRSQNTRFFPRTPDVRYQGRVHEQIIDTTRTRLRYHTGVNVWHEGYQVPDDALERKTKRNIALLLDETRVSPRDGYYLYQLGKSYEQLRDLASARKYFDASLQNSSSDYAYYPELLLATLYNYKSLGLKQETWSLLDYAVQLYPNTTDFYFFLGRALIDFQVPDLRLIKRAFETCLELQRNPSSQIIVEGVGSYLALYNLGVFYESMSDFTNARDLYRRAGDMGYSPAFTGLNRVNNM